MSYQLLLAKLRYRQLAQDFLYQNAVQVGYCYPCTGGAQSYIEHAININADCFITGEVSEQIPAIAKENDIAFISAGHNF
jgi:putative NIF3 family GTP cyclohydrolase 1 type 2